MAAWMLPAAMIGSSLLGGLGGIRQESAGRSASARQMAFQERMRETQYQTAVEDMRAAGLNPMLAYQQGGAGTPSGSTYQPQNIGAAAAQGLQQGASAYATSMAGEQTEQNVRALKKIGSSTDLVKRTLPNRLGSRIEKILDPFLKKIEAYLDTPGNADRAEKAVKDIGSIPKAEAKKMPTEEFEKRSEEILDQAEEDMEKRKRDWEWRTSGWGKNSGKSLLRPDDVLIGTVN